MNIGKAFIFHLKVGLASTREKKEPHAPKKEWETFKVPAYDMFGKETHLETHVVPLADLEHHLTAEDCGCEPIEDPLATGYYLHRAFDGRDLVARCELGFPLL